MYMAGMCCDECDTGGDCGGEGLAGKWSGLGFYIDPQMAASMLVQAKTTITNAIAQIENFLGIGQGRTEADLIVPTQNQITSTVLAPISAAVQEPGIHTETCDALTATLNTLNQTEQKWLIFLHDARWTDGRASQQAETTLAPYFSGLRQDLTDEINARCGIIGSVGGSNTMLFAGVGIAALLLLRGKRG